MKGLLCYAFGFCTFFSAVCQNSPIVGSIPDLNIPEGMVYVLNISASDPDPEDSLSFEILNLPEFANFSETANGQAVINIHSSFLDAGQYSITVRVYDQSLNSDEDSFTLTIEENVPKASSQELSNFNYSINAGGTLDYYVYYPQNYDAYPNDQPVLIYLHGLGMRGGSPTKLITSENDGAPSHYLANGGDLPMMVITPHQPVWIGGVSYSTWNIPLLKELVEHIKSTFNVDQDRIYLTGFSNGGQSAWQYAIEHKEDLAALIAVAGRTNLTNQPLYGMNLQDPEYACQISDLPINVWHSFNDEVINIGHATNMVETIDDCTPSPNPTPQLHVLSGISHGGTRPYVYGNINGPDNIYNWMLSYVRGIGFVDTDPPTFINSTPSISNIMDVSFDFNVDLNEVGSVYYALYDSVFTPTSDEVISGAGSSIVSFGSLSNIQSVTKNLSGLRPETTYYLWIVAEDAVSPPNRQPSPILLTVTTQEEIIDNQAPIYDNEPSILDIKAGSVQLSLDIDESGIIHWGLFDLAYIPTPDDLLSQTNGLQYGSLNTEGTVEEFVISGLFKGTEYKIGVLATDDELSPNVQTSVFTLVFSTDSIEEGVVPDRKYLLNITENSSPSNEFGWNDLGFDGFSGSKVFTGLVDSQENPGTLGLTVYNGEEGSSINDVADNGSGYANGSIFPPNIVRYGAYTTGWGILDFTNLDPNKYYSFNVLGSRNASGSRTTDFIINSETLTLESINNLSTTVTFEKLSPPSNGRLRLRFDPGNSNWGYLNLIEVEEYNQLSGDTLSPAIQPLLTATQVSESEVEITWAGSNDQDLAGYSLYRSLISTPSTELLENILQANIQGNVYLDSTVIVGQQYYYWVIATDSAGNYSNRSAIDSVLMITSDTVPPIQPTGLSASLIETDRVHLSWDTNPEMDISGYTLSRGLNPSFEFESGTVIGPIGATSFIDSLLLDETSYYYRVKATDLSGNQSQVSDLLSITTLDGTPPNLPDTVILNATTEAIEISWSKSNSPDAAGYNLFRTVQETNIVYDTIGVNPLLSLTKNIYLQFENNVVDQSGNGVNSSTNSGLTYTNQDQIEGNYSAQFDGANSVISIDEGDTFIHSSFSAKSVLLWMKANTSVGVQDIYDEGGSTNGIGIRINDGFIEGVVQDNHDIRMVRAPFEVGKWNHVALVYNQSTLNLYLNGEPVGSQITPFSSVNTHSDAGGLGGTNGSNAFDSAGSDFSGNIDEFMIIPSALETTILSSYYKYYNPIIDTIGVSLDTLLSNELGSNDTLYVDITAESGIEYGYFLSVNDSAGNESAYTNPVYGMLDSITYDPPPSPQNIQVSLSGTDALDLNWDDVTTGGFSHYTLYRSTNSFSAATEAEYVVDSILTTNYLDISLLEEFTYYYRISATNIEGEESDLSAIASYTIPDSQSPLAPIDLVVTGDTSRIEISWQDGGSSDVAGYNIYRNTGSAPTVDSAYFYTQELTTSYIDNDVTELTNYYYVVTAFDEVDNESTGSDPGSASPENVTAPLAPEGVTATLIGDNEISLSWDANAELDLAGYRLYRGLTPGFMLEGNLLADSISEVSYIDLDLDYETTYFYVVTAFDVVGNESAVGLQVSSTTDIEVELPGVPQNLWLSLSGTDALDLNWDDVTTGGFSHYTLYRSTNSFSAATEAEYVVDSILTTNYLDISLLEEFTYYYRISATNIEGEESDLSAIASYTIPDSQSPLAPIDLVVTGDTSRIEISWQDGGSSDVAGYNIYRNTGSAPTVDSAYFYTQELTTSYIDNDVTELTNYYYVVTAFDEVDNESTGSDPGSASPENVTAPLAPEGVTATLIGDNEISLSWDANAELDLAGYRLYRGLTPGFMLEGNLLADSISEVSYIDLDLDYETTYFYVVTAFDVVGNESDAINGINILTNSEPIETDIIKTVMVNFTESGSYSGNISWNDLAIENVDKFQTFANLTDSLGLVTSIDLTVFNGQLGSTINNVADNGTGLNGGIYPDQVARFGAYTTNIGVMIFEKLDVNHTYDISLLSGRIGSGSRVTEFELNQSQVGSVESINNTLDLVSFESVSPQPDGSIEIRFSKSNSNWGYINAVVLHEHGEDLAGARVISSNSSAGNISNSNGIVTDESIYNKEELVDLAYDFSIFPNPAKNKLEITFKEPLDRSTSMILRNLQGKEMVEIPLSSGNQQYEINLAYPSGVYFLIIPLDKGTFISEKILIE